MRKWKPLYVLIQYEKLYTKFIFELYAYWTKLVTRAPEMRSYMSLYDCVRMFVHK